MREYLPFIVSIIVTILVSAALIFVIYVSMTRNDEKLWNDGHCDVCGGVWRYEQAVGHRSHTSYIYVCGDCGKRIEINDIR